MLRHLLGALVLALSLAGGILLSCVSAHARCTGGPRDPLIPTNTHCEPTQFLDQAFASQSYYHAAPGAGAAMLQSCTDSRPWKRPPARWCSAAASAQLGRR